jgi:hypothetical protein
MIRLGKLINLPALKEAELAPAPFVHSDANADGKVNHKDKKINDRRTAKLEESDESNEDESVVTEDVTGAVNNMEDDNVDDHEGQMAKADLLSIHKKAGELYNMISEDEELEGWVQAKITKAAEYINAVHNSMQYEKSKPASIGNGEGNPADATQNQMAESVTADTEETLDEVSPKGWEKTVLAMKKKKQIDNPFALANWMKSKGYTPHKGKKGKKE